MKLSIKNVTPAIFLCLIGSCLLLTGIFKTLPVGDPQPQIEAWYFQVLLILLGGFFIVLGVIPFLKEIHGVSNTENIKIIAKEITDLLIPQFSDIRPFFSKSIFDERRNHYYKEKVFLADQFVPYLLERIKTYTLQGKKVYLLIDSGTTLYYFLEKIGTETVEIKEDWLSNVNILTNNLLGVLRFMQTAKTSPNRRYSPLAVHCELLPGVPLPVYSAVTGERTEKALALLRDEIAEKHEDAIVIALVTGNWVRIRRTTPECPVPLARGKGHKTFKEAIINNSDEIFVITPLGKIFSNIPAGEVNIALGFIGTDNNPDNEPYGEVNINSEKARSVKLITTLRSEGTALYTHSVKIKSLMNGIEAENEQKTSYAKGEISSLRSLFFCFNDLPDEWNQQIETEFPHQNTRTDQFLSKYFDVKTHPLRKY